MITIKTWEHGAVITGHAGYAPIGYDIVCASISALFCNLVYSLQELTKARIRYKMDAGQSYIVYKDGGEGADGGNGAREQNTDNNSYISSLYFCTYSSPEEKKVRMAQNQRKTTMNPN